MASRIIGQLELRLDNVVFRAGFARTNAASRQLVRHSHLTVNGRVVNIPSAQLRVGDVIAIRERAIPAVRLQQSRGAALAKPDWLDVDDPRQRHAGCQRRFPIKMQLVIGFYASCPSPTKDDPAQERRLARVRSASPARC